MIQLGLFDPAPPVPTVADLLDRTWAPSPWPEGYACIYKATLVGTTRAYVGKAVDLLERFRARRYANEYIDRALNAHGPENFSIEVLRVALSEAYAYAQEGSFIEAHRTRKAHGGYNIGEGGEGFTSADAKSWANSTEGRANAARNGDRQALRAGYPQRRVLAELEKEPRTIDSLMTLLGLTRRQIYDAIHSLRDNGYLIIRGKYGGLFRLVTPEGVADAWAGGDALTNQNRVLGLLMKEPCTTPELMAVLGLSRYSIKANTDRLRERGYNIVNRGAKIGPGGHFGTLHLIIDHKRLPWLHLGTMDLRGAALDDPTFSLQYLKG